MPGNPVKAKLACPTAIGPTVEQLEMLSRLAAVLGIAVTPARSKTEVPSTISASDAGVLADALLDRMTRRVPQAADTKKGIEAEVCPYTGLNRGQFYELFNLVENGEPVIESMSFKQEGEAHGARFYNVGSVVRYMKRLAEQQAGKAAN
jgi:hypothetical protein